jgi:hypothetical protein
MAEVATSAAVLLGNVCAQQAQFASHSPEVVTHVTTLSSLVVTGHHLRVDEARGVVAKQLKVCVAPGAFEFDRQNKSLFNNQIDGALKWTPPSTPRA